LTSNEARCIFERKNDILARIEDILIWTKNERNTWYDDPGLTMMASATLLKMEYNRNNLNINWVEEQIKHYLKNDVYLKTVDSFCYVSAGLLALFLAKRKSKRSIFSFIRKNITQLKKRNWMNSAKTTMFLILPLKEITNEEDILRREGITDEIEEYLTNIMEDPKISYENLAYALFSLSFINPNKAKDFLIRKPKLLESLVKHERIEIKAVLLQAFDKVGMPCAESVYQEMWDHFEKHQYGRIERSILSKITASIYDMVAGLKGKVETLSIETINEKTKIALTIPTSSLDEMVKSIAPLDQLCIVALSILYSTYRALYLFTRRRFDDYQRLQGLETRLTHTPVKNEDLTKVSTKIQRYEATKIVTFHIIAPIAAFVLSIVFSYFLTPYTQPLQSPLREIVLAALPAFFGPISFYQAVLVTREEWSKIKKKVKKLESEGKWEDTNQTL